jgi:hypothetical protein
MLFLLAMEPLHRLFKRAQEVGLLSKVTRSCDNFRLSLYADAAALFIKPTSNELEATHCILDIFAGASGLKTNMEKTQFFPIQCDHINLDFLSQNNLVVSSFPCNYLGLPLHTKKLPKYLLLEVIQKIAKKLPGWQRGFLSHPSRETLIKVVLFAMPTFFLTVFKMPK